MQKSMIHRREEHADERDERYTAEQCIKGGKQLPRARLQVVYIHAFRNASAPTTGRGYFLFSLNFTPSFHACPTCSPSAQKRLSGMVSRKGRIFFGSGFPSARY